MRRRRTGGSRLGCLFLFFAVAMIWGGGQGVYTGFRNRAPKSMTMTEYLSDKPDAEWLELRDAYIFLPGAAHFYRELVGDSTAATDEIYVPLYPVVPETTDVPSRVLLKTRDPKLVELYNEIGRTQSDTALERLAQERWSEMTAKRTVRGLVQFGVDLQSDEVEKLRISANTEDFIVLAEGDEPEAGVGMVMLLAGIGLLVLGGWLLAKKDTAEVTVAENSEKA